MTINYHRAGGGPPLVLLHGIGHHWQGWWPVIADLRRSFEVIAYDSPGFGGSPPLPAGFWTPTERRFCQLSLGFLGSVPGLLRPAVRALAATRTGRAVLFKQTFGWPTRMPPDEAQSTLDDAWAAPAFAEALAAFDDYEFTAGDELRGVPVTIAWGREDRLLIYSRQAPRARQRLPWARHVTLGAGHVPFFDDPAAVAETIRLTTKAAKC